MTDAEDETAAASATGPRDGRPAPSAAARWTAELQAWAIPEAVLAAAPRDPYAFPPHAIRTAATDPLGTPTGEAVLERLEPGETLLDVGVGRGRIAGAFLPRHPVVGVEPRPALAADARALGVQVVQGRWPDVAAAAGRAPVVLCTHVLYDVQDPVPFLRALHAAAERRVVLEVTAAHPWVPLRPLYRIAHDLDRPDGPTADLLADVVAEAVGTRPHAARWTRPGSRAVDLAAHLDHQLQVTCIDAAHPAAAAVEAAARAAVTVDADGTAHLPPVEQATLWWDTGG